MNVTQPMVARGGTAEHGDIGRAGVGRITQPGTGYSDAAS
jgi:hypothetical protein